MGIRKALRSPGYRACKITVSLALWVLIFTAAYQLATDRLAVSNGHFYEPVTAPAAK
jgi:hypothetical protein